MFEYFKLSYNIKIYIWNFKDNWSSEKQHYDKNLKILVKIFCLRILKLLKICRWIWLYGRLREKLKLDFFEEETIFSGKSLTNKDYSRNMNRVYILNLKTSY